MTFDDLLAEEAFQMRKKLTENATTIRQQRAIIEDLKEKNAVLLEILMKLRSADC